MWRLGGLARELTGEEREGSLSLVAVEADRGLAPRGAITELDSDACHSCRDGDLHDGALGAIAELEAKQLLEARAVDRSELTACAQLERTRRSSGEPDRERDRRGDRTAQSRIHASTRARCGPLGKRST